MEIEQLHKELTHLLNNVADHTDGFSGDRQLQSLEVATVLVKINKIQEKLIILKHLIEIDEASAEQNSYVEKEIIEEKPVDVASPLIDEDQTVLSNDDVKQEFFEKEIVEVKPVEEVVSSVVEQLQQAPIKSLVDTLTLNDRYLYANELFDKDMSAFNGLINKIENSNSIDAAQNLFNQVGAQYNWDVESDLVIKFMGLIERRFS